MNKIPPGCQTLRIDPSTGARSSFRAPEPARALPVEGRHIP